MKSKNNKLRQRREVKKPVSAGLIKRVEKATLGYGKLLDFAVKADLNYATIHALKTSGQATDTVRKKVELALKAA